MGRIKGILAYKGNLSTYSVIGLCVLFISSSNFIVSFLLQKCINSAKSLNRYDLTVYSILFILFSVVCGGGYYLYGKYRSKLTQEVGYKIKTELYARWIHSDQLQNKQMDDGEIVTIMTKDADLCSEFVSYTVVPLAEIALSVIVGSLYTIYYSPLIFGVVVVMSVVLVILITHTMSFIGDAYKKKQEILDEQNDFLFGLYRGLTFIMINRYLSYIVKKHRLISKQRIHQEVVLSQEEAKNNLLMENGILIIELVVLLLGAMLVQEKHLTVGAMIGIWNASIGTFVYPLIDFPDVVNGITETLNSFDRITKILSLKSRNNEKSRLIHANEIKMVDVCVKKGEREIVKDFSCSFHKNKVYIINGESGVGKTTILKVLLGFCEYGQGEILVDGEPIEPGDLYQMFAYLPQGNSLFRTSMKNNILMSGCEWNEELVREYCRSLGILDCITRCSLGFDGIYGIDIVMSEGQSLRFSFIRTLLSEAPFLMLDEPFSSINHEDARKVVDLLEKVKGTRGVICVTHKYMDLLHYDEHIKVDRGIVDAK